MGQRCRLRSMPRTKTVSMSSASRKSLPRNSFFARGGSIRIDPGPAGLPVNVTCATLPANRHSTNSARAGVQPSSFASSNEHFSKRVPSGLICRRSAPSNLHEMKTLRGRVVKNGANFSSRRRPRKSHATKFATASWNLSNLALRKSTFARPARPTEMTAPLGWLGPLSCWDTAAGRELPRVGQLRRLLRVGLLAVLDQDLIDLREQRVHELRLWIGAHDLAFAEDRALPHSAGDADVGVLGLAGAVHLAAHDRDLHRRCEGAQALLGDLRERYEIDVRAAARWARDEREALVAQAKRLEQIERRLHLDYWVLAERDADRVADALVEENTHPGGRTYRPGERGPRLGHAEMQWIRDRLRETAVRGDHHRDVESLDADDDVVEVEILEDLDLGDGEIDHPLGLVADIAGLAITDGAVVHADADGGSLRLRAAHDLAHAVLVVDVSRVETELVDLRVERHEREPVVEVDVGDDREDRAAHDLLEGLAGALVGHGHASDLAAALLELLDLTDGGVDVVRERGAHGLHRHRSPIADRRAAHPDALGF